MMLSQIPEIDPNVIINRASESGSDSFFLITVLVVCFVAYQAAVLYFITIPREKSDRENQTKIADGFRAISTTINKQQDLMTKQTSCIEGIERILEDLQKDHTTTHRSIKELFHALDHTLKAFGDRAEGPLEKQAVENIHKAVEKGQEILSNKIHGM